ncbi:class I SAM-dependent methyltransferase [Micromonospora sp. 15K316]|uniref:class I SAM-dependent methyltransferase n=1 Tax=Micromonospora sp. 15K316 TaxID=2530376 RepID=UPI0010432F62|nr:class I SAM-dependent methyltransferase [Micromonospora sp. 15K316]TDC37390.1 class I SAM-dependent methyltransferase [Micromonospora sp. 15K316]
MSCSVLGRHPDVGDCEAVPRPQPSTRPAVVSPRQRWAVETMAVAPDDQVLEIGCGRGTAVSLVAGRLTSGRIVAVDRSAAMARLAAERNEAHVNAGRAEIRCAEFEPADYPPAHFTKIFAVNVSLFWLGATTSQIDRMRGLLAPGGRLYVFGERPTSVHATANATATERLLARHGFTTITTTATRGQGRVLTCVTGTPVR